MTESELREALCAAGRRLDTLGLVGGTEGNLSARLGPDQILCTPQGVRKGALTPAELVLCDLEGIPAGAGEPSTEIRVHLVAYELCPDCAAVIHAHPPYATAYACTAETFPSQLTVEAAVVLGTVPTLPFASPGTPDVSNGMRAYVQECRALLLGHHGAVCWGESLEDALVRMEILERVAQLGVLTAQLGGATPVPELTKNT